MAEEKKLIFFSLIDKYTLLAIKILKCYSIDNYQRYDEKIYRENNPNPNSMMKTYTHHGQEKPMEYLTDEIPELEDDPQLAKIIVTQLQDDGLIEPIDFTMPAYPDTTRKKHTTDLGDEFIEFINQ
jgi:hypothetical protein